jgi:hypothetical protein
VAIGDTEWRDYEVTVPITVAAIDPAGFNAISTAPGVGVRLRWTGHTDQPYSYRKQPLFGWLPVGASGWYDFGRGTFKLYLNCRLTGEKAIGEIRLGSTWYFKLRMETLPSGHPRCSFRFWPAGRNEPAEWLLDGVGDLSDPPAGSIVLVAHHVDARFGNLTVVPVGSGRD